jgi:hypothetical protein
MRRDHDSQADGLRVCPQSRKKFLHGFRFWIWDKSSHIPTPTAASILPARNGSEKRSMDVVLFFALKFAGTTERSNKFDSSVVSLTRNRQRPSPLNFRSSCPVLQGDASAIMACAMEVPIAAFMRGDSFSRWWSAGRHCQEGDFTGI